MSDRLDLTYSVFKTVRGSLPVYYLQSPDGYVLLTACDPYLYVSRIVQESDISDFQTNIQPSSVQVGSFSDGVALATVASRIPLPVFEANLRKDGIDSTRYFVLVDRDNSTGNYKHPQNSVGGVKIFNLQSLIIKGAVGHKWSVRLGTILSIDGTQAVVGWIRAGTTVNRDSFAIYAEQNVVPFPLSIDCVVESGDFKRITSNFKETLTDVNTGVQVPDATDASVTPAVGDIILKAINFGGAGSSLLLHYHVWYSIGA